MERVILGKDLAYALSNNLLGGDILKELGDCSYLNEVKLNDHNIFGSIPKH